MENDIFILKKESISLDQESNLHPTEYVRATTVPSYRDNDQKATALEGKKSKTRNKEDNPYVTLK